jgi:PAS domain S-box-containing protein
LGLSGPDVFGQPISKFLPDSKLRDIINTGATVFGRKLQFNNKTFITNDSPLKYKGKITGAVTIFQDISDLENISQELKYTKELKEELDTIVESSFDGIYLTDSYGKILRTNSALTRITGIKKEELSDKTMTELVDSGVFDQAIAPDVMLKGKPITISQRVKTGKTILVTSNPILDHHKNVFRIVHNARDITELNNLKNQLEKAESLSQHYKEQLNKMKLSNKFIAKSKKSRELVELVLRLSGVDTTVLILGESGVGKDIIAEMLHENSHRQDKLFLAINCAAIPDNLLESELFGYEPGAFTGAHKKGRLGAFELANGGTLFLDEIAELPVNLQSKLLRVIQKKEITKLGGNLPVKVDVRIITATNRDLWEMALNNTFRKDLYYRLNIVPITISPLRDRKEEIPDLVSHFTRVFNKKYGFNKRFDERSIHEMMSYDWPGNVRELENVIERSIVTSPDDIIYYLELPNRQSESNERPSVDYTELEFNVAVECFERELIKNALLRFGTTRKAAAKLGVSQPTVVRKASKYNIKI